MSIPDLLREAALEQQEYDAIRILQIKAMRDETKSAVDSNVAAMEKTKSELIVLGETAAGCKAAVETTAAEIKAIRAGTESAAANIAGNVTTAEQHAVDAKAAAAQTKAHFNTLPINVKLPPYNAVGDGVTDDYKAIAAALKDNADRGGGAIYFPRGRYATSKRIAPYSSNTTLCGDGRDLSIICAINPGTDNDASTGCLILVNPNSSDGVSNRLTDIYIHDLGLDMTAIYDNLDSVTWNTAWNGKCGALSIRACDNVIVRDVFIRKTCHEGLDVIGCYNVTVDNVDGEYLKGITWGNGYVWGGNFFSFMAGGNDTNQKIGSYTITNCHICGSEHWPSPVSNNCTEECNLGIMVMTGGPTDHQIDPVVVQNCVVERAYWGFMAEGMLAGGAGSVTVTDCVFKNCVAGAALFPDCKGDVGHVSRNYIFANNQIKNVLSIGIEAIGENVIIEGNVVTDWGLLKDKSLIGKQQINAVAICLMPAFGSCSTAGIFKNVTIANNICTLSAPHDNTFVNAVTGLHIDNTHVKDRIFSNVKIQGNTFDAGGSTFTDYPPMSAGGIYVKGNIQNLDVAGNTITGFPACAVYFDIIESKADGVDTTDLDWVPKHVRITDNVFYDNASGSKYGGLYAVTTRGNVQYLEVSRNHVYQISNTDMVGALSIPQYKAANVKADHVIALDNVYYNLKGDKPFDLNIDGKKLIRDLVLV